MTGVIATAQSALNAMTVSMAATANNLANLDTDGYKAERVGLQTGEDGQGVAVSGVTRDESTGGLRPDTVSSGFSQEAGDIVDISDRGVRMAETSNVDPARESVSMIESARGFEANVAVIRTQDDMAGALLDMQV
jgi:flagellar basal-body rod protein FlgC